MMRRRGLRCSGITEISVASPDAFVSGRGSLTFHGLQAEVLADLLDAADEGVILDSPDRYFTSTVAMLSASGIEIAGEPWPRDTPGAPGSRFVLKSVLITIERINADDCSLRPFVPGSRPSPPRPPYNPFRRSRR